MVWNISCECIASIVLAILWTYSRKGNVAPNWKNRLFQICFLTTFLAIVSNIISTLLIYDMNRFVYYPAWIANTVYFIATPLMGVAYFLYTLATLYENQKITKQSLFLILLPGLLYILIILCNPWTHWIFSLSLQGYARGPYIILTYLVFYLYCLMCIVLVVWKGSFVDKTIRRILFSFPLIAGVVIVVQQVFPDIILSGSAATIALLMIYLYMQNKQISIDYLTKLPNRQEFLNMLDVQVNHKNTAFTIILLSLRDFKRTNDIFGQYIGDCFLIEVCDYLKKTFCLKEGSLYRYSGDEYAIMLSQVSQQEVNSIVERIKQRMTQPWNCNHYATMLSAAIAIVAYPDCADTMEQVMNGIDFSVNLAKNDAANHHVCYCTPAILNKVRRKQEIIEILRDCLIHHRFEVYYQPIYHLKKHCFVSAEALLRIPDSTLGPIYPDEFIPVAEESGLIIDITYEVLDMVCHTIQKMKALAIPFKEINVNFSTLQFLQPDLMEQVIAILKRHDVEGNKIKIEITESTLSENADVMSDYVAKMQSYGITMGLDDFGTGYSNAGRVISMPFETIKLDKSLVWASLENARSSAFLQSIVEVFSRLHYTVLAEGVETQEQSDFVEACGCILIQGYFYAKAMPQKQFIQFMQEHIT